MSRLKGAECLKLLSVVLPSYNEELNIQRTIDRLSAVLQEASIPYELIFVNDGSRDETWTMIQKAWQERDDVIGIDFSRNFGKEAAILAGLAHANGSCCAVIDCDLQHPPEKLVEMYRLWEQGYDLIEGVKRSRGKESFLHKLCAGGFYWIMSYVTHVDMSRASDFRLMDRKVVDALVSMPERGIFFRALSSWVGFKSTTIEFDVQEREIGESKWSFTSLIKYAIRNIVSFSGMPLKMIAYFGFAGLLFTIVLGIQTLVRYWSGNAVEGFTTVILLILLTSSMIMISLGIIGLYLARMYEEIKQRPRYIIHHHLKGKKKSCETNMGLDEQA